MEEDESATIQIILKPVADDWQKKCSTYSTKLMKGKKVIMSFNPIHIIISIIQSLFEGKNDEKKNTGDEHETSALSQEKAKTVDEK